MDHATGSRSIVLKYPIQITLIIALTALTLSCGQKDNLVGPDDFPYSGPILIWNLSQFELLEVYAHSGQGFNDNGDNQIDLPLQPDDTAIIQWTSGYRVSVVREKTEGGFLMGLTTQQAPAFNQAQSVLIVFDDGFRALSSSYEANSTPGFPGFPDEILNHQNNNPQAPYDN